MVREVGDRVVRDRVVGDRVSKYREDHDWEARYREKQGLEEYEEEQDREARYRLEQDREEKDHDSFLFEDSDDDYGVTISQSRKEESFCDGRGVQRREEVVRFVRHPSKWHRTDKPRHRATEPRHPAHR